MYSTQWSDNQRKVSYPAVRVERSLIELESRDGMHTNVLHLSRHGFFGFARMVILLEEHSLDFFLFVVRIIPAS
jgi:hypothetical protein